MKLFAFARVLIFSCCSLALTTILFTVSAAGQIPPRAATDQITADEDFELNIVESHVTERTYKRSTRVEISTGNLSVGAGAEVQAARIDIVLRGVTGRVRFRASLESLRHLIERARALPRQPAEP